jgi:hypothetical protein
MVGTGAALQEASTMTEAARGYLVRDADSTRGKGAKVDQIYPYTLRGLTEALEEARFRSHSGAPQVLAILGTGNTRIIRRFEDGREVPVAPLPRLPPVDPTGEAATRSWSTARTASSSPPVNQMTGTAAGSILDGWTWMLSCGTATSPFAGRWPRTQWPRAGN